MFRVLLGGLAATVALASSVPALAGEAKLIRIEPRAFYGATITLESGVRVFRPLPRTSRTIINPGHKTPLNLTIEDRAPQNININNSNTNTAVGGSRSFFSDGIGGFRGFRGARRAPRVRVNGSVGGRFRTGR